MLLLYIAYDNLSKSYLFILILDIDSLNSRIIVYTFRGCLVRRESMAYKTDRSLCFFFFDIFN